MSDGQTPDRGTVLKVFLFTDLVGSTELKGRIGDAAYATAIAQHDRLFRSCLQQFGGTEHDNAGDGFLAIFDVPSQALRCALAFQQALTEIDAEEPLRVRMGRP